MRNLSYPTVLAAAFVLAMVVPGAAEAQFGGFVNLPRNDFTWVWGDQDDAERGRGRDINVRSIDRGFDCTLTAALSPSNRMTTMDIRQLENNLRTAMDFIYYSANTMYSLERSFDLDWGKLDCARMQPTEADEDKQQERVNRALERARREQAERRERRERQEARENRR